MVLRYILTVHYIAQVYIFDPLFLYPSRILSEDPADLICRQIWFYLRKRDRI